MTTQKLKQVMILAAGFGTRLKPLTDSVPKALIPLAGQPLLEWQIRRFQKIGWQDFIINTHYLAEQVEEFAASSRRLGRRLTLSHEVEILGTGGGLLQTQFFWHTEPFIVHNVDIICTVDLNAVERQHRQWQSLVTLLVKQRPSDTQLLIDEARQLCGIHYRKKNDYRLLRQPEGKITEVGFCGIHVLSPPFFGQIRERGNFSIIDTYLRLAAENQSIHTFDIGEEFWMDIGKMAQLQQIEQLWNADEKIKNIYC